MQNWRRKRETVCLVISCRPPRVSFSVAKPIIFLDKVRWFNSRYGIIHIPSMSAWQSFICVPVRMVKRLQDIYCKLELCTEKRDTPNVGTELCRDGRLWDILVGDNCIHGGDFVSLF